MLFFTECRKIFARFARGTTDKICQKSLDSMKIFPPISSSFSHSDRKNLPIASKTYTSAIEISSIIETFVLRSVDAALELNFNPHVVGKWSSSDN